MYIDKDAKSSHSKDVKRGEVLDNIRVLLSVENELDQRRSVFCTRCKCENKCCNGIIDQRKNEYLVSKKMSMKLNLKN